MLEIEGVVIHGKGEAPSHQAIPPFGDFQYNRVVYMLLIFNSHLI